MSTYLPTFAQTHDNILHLFNCVYQMWGKVSQNPERQQMSPVAFPSLTQAQAFSECSQCLFWASLLPGHSWDILAICLLTCPCSLLEWAWGHQLLGACIPKGHCRVTALGRMTLVSSVLNLHLLINLLRICQAFLVPMWALFFHSDFFLCISSSIPLSSVVWWLVD